MRWRARLFFAVIQEGVCLFALFLGLRLDHLAQSKAQTMEHRRPGTGRGQLRRPIPLIAERLQGRLGCQPGGGQAGAECRVLLRLGFGELTQGLRHVRMLLFPTCAATEGRWRAQAHDPGASLAEAACHGLAAPPTDGFRHQGMAPTILQGHLGLKSPSFWDTVAAILHSLWTGQSIAFLLPLPPFFPQGAQHVRTGPIRARPHRGEYPRQSPPRTAPRGLPSRPETDRVSPVQSSRLTPYIWTAPVA